MPGLPSNSPTEVLRCRLSKRPWPDGVSPGPTENEEKGGNRRPRFIHQSALLFGRASFDLGFRGQDRGLFNTCGQKNRKKSGQSGVTARIRVSVLPGSRGTRVGQDQEPVLAPRALNVKA
jgi:hypothetical protein